jgi:type IV pilus modification protein PilV
MKNQLNRQPQMLIVGAGERGFSLIELLIAMFVLTVGMLGGAAVIAVAIASNANAKFDTGAVSLAQSAMDRIIVISQSAPGNTNMTDCNGTVHAMSTAIGGAPTTTISGLANGTQVIDFSKATVPGYQMNYTMCAAGGAGNTGIPQVFDVRWNVSQGPTQTTQLVLVAAKSVNESGNGVTQTKYFSVPITLRAIRGN